MVDRNCKAAEPPSAPTPCRSGDRGRSAPAAGGSLRAYRPAHKPNQRFGRGARTVCCANAQKDRAPEGARISLSTTLTARILTMFAAPINPCLSELQRGRPFDRSAAFAASLTPCKAPQLCCGFLRRGFARGGLRRCLKLRQGAPRPLEPRQGRMALNPVAQALPTGVLWHQGFAFEQCLRHRSIVVCRNCNAADPLTAPRRSPHRSHRAKHRNFVADFCAGALPGAACGAASNSAKGLRAPWNLARAEWP